MRKRKWFFFDGIGYNEVMIQKMMERLKAEDLSLYSIGPDGEYTSRASGIFPVLDPMRRDRFFFKDCLVADKLIGKASGILLIYSSVKEVYGIVMSKNAVELFEHYGIPYHYDTLVERIVNRRGDDLCPMEKTVADIDDPEEGYEALKKRLSELSKGAFNG